jgi:hypothetical protein
MAEMLEPESPMPAAVTRHLKHLSSFSSIQPSIQSSTQSSIQSSVIDSAIRPLPLALFHFLSNFT